MRCQNFKDLKNKICYEIIRIPSDMLKKFHIWIFGSTGLLLKSEWGTFAKIKSSIMFISFKSYKCIICHINCQKSSDVIDNMTHGDCSYFD